MWGDGGKRERQRGRERGREREREGERGGERVRSRGGGESVLQSYNVPILHAKKLFK